MHTSPRTGKATDTQLVEVGVSREAFLDLELANVNAIETLRYLNADLSPNMFKLIPISNLKKIRKA
jgi:hypothetical protein